MHHVSDEKRKVKEILVFKKGTGVANHIKLVIHQIFLFIGLDYDEDSLEYKVKQTQNTCFASNRTISPLIITLRRHIDENVFVNHSHLLAEVSLNELIKHTNQIESKFFIYFCLIFFNF
jgi:hypothetical protein